MSQVLSVAISKLLERKSDRPKDTGRYFLVTFLMAIEVFAIVLIEAINWNIDISVAKKNDPVPTESPVLDEQIEENNPNEILVNDTGKDLHETVETYILAGSSRVISEEELASWDDELLYFVRNGLFARAGRAFIEEELMRFYGEFDWYNGYIEPQDFKWDMLNAYQSKTIENIRKVEKSRR